MEMSEWIDRLELISDGYAEVYGIDRSPEWMLLKLTEELGELSQAWLVASGQGRDRNQSPAQAQATLAAECADVVAMALLTARRMGVDKWVRRFTEVGRPGAYLRVVKSGPVAAGDPVVVTYRPEHGVTIGEVFAGLTPERARAVLESGERLAPKVVRDVSKVLARSSAAASS